MQFSKATIKIYGAYPSASAFSLHVIRRKALLLFPGRAADAEKVIGAARVLIARFGAEQKETLNPCFGALHL
jgi:hypothetical protein